MEYTYEYVLKNLIPNINDIIQHHNELAYKLIVSPCASTDINLKYPISSLLFNPLLPLHYT